MRIHIDYFGYFDMKKQYHGLLRELEAYQKNSVNLKRNGVTSTPFDIADACLIMEEGSYMREYDRNDDENDDGSVREVSFHKVDRDFKSTDSNSQ